MLFLLCSLLLLVLPQETAPAAVSANIWEGREPEFEQFLKTARVVKIEDVPIGVTKPRRAYVEPGGLCESFAWKTLYPGVHKGHWDSYKSEIAAYELDKHIGLGMVPVTVQRKVKSDEGAAIIWLKGVRSWEEALRSPKTSKWTRNVVRMKMWDNLVGNPDRNKGNLLVDYAGNLFLIDHSRAFTSDRKLFHDLEKIDMELWNKMLALDFPTLKEWIGEWVGNGELRAILQRRDKMQKEIAAVLAKEGDLAIVK
jgi:Phosphatidylinositol 3- and 4-kinase